MAEQKCHAPLDISTGWSGHSCLLAYIRPKQAIAAYEHIGTRRRLPHWKKDGAIYWITFRLADAIPRDKHRALHQERNLWLQLHPEPWTDSEWKEYNRRFEERIEYWLDAGMGSRILARVDVREVVRKSLLRFNGDRLQLHAAVIMPTHVHLLIEPFEGRGLSRILKGIKGASARGINKLNGGTGSVWLDESYDHVVRSEEQYWRFVRYIAENPSKAGLDDHEFWIHKGGARLTSSCSPAGKP